MFVEWAARIGFKKVLIRRSKMEEQALQTRNGIKYVF
jgi:hypothetical protein